MARDFAAVNLAIWQDPDFRDLPADAKLLYLTLWTHPQLSRAGVVDWRPGRLAALIDNTWTAEHLRTVGDCLEARLFIVTDEQTEECLIRSWVRFDGLMKSPVMSVTFANEYAAVVSTPIREVIVHELHKLRDKEPTLAAWSKDRVLEVLEMPSLDPRSRDLPTDPLTPALTPTVTPCPTPSGGKAEGSANPSTNHPPTPAPAPSPFSPGSPGVTSPADAVDEKKVRDDVRRLCDRLASRIEANDVKRPTITKTWQDSARLLIDKDGHTETEIARIIDWATNDDFWRTNILSMPTLRKQFDQLRLKAGTARGNVRHLPGGRPSDDPTPGTPEFDALPFPEQARISAARTQAWRQNL